MVIGDSRPTLKSVAQASAGEVGMPNLDRLSDFDDSPVRQVGALGVRECKEPCLLQQQDA